MGRGAPIKWSKAQVDATRAASLQGLSSRAIMRAQKAGELPGYKGDAMPAATIQYHARRAREELIAESRARFQPDAIRRACGEIMAGLLEAARSRGKKTERALRNGKPEAWEELERAAKAIDAVARVNDRLNAAGPGPKTPRTNTKASSEDAKPTDIVDQLAASTEPSNGTKPR